ncbi:MAG TPA: ankyrin repeat domain-containing protein [Terracidiphilus sp.]|nr:ankyrin repeat domain-containing protein [Terracidiphilus sp.]
MDVKTAIRQGDAAALRLLLAEDASLADALIRWGHNDCIHTHPLHYVSDMIFDGTLKRGAALPLLEALIQSGADLDFQRDGKGDTPLIGAASLIAEDVGLRLLEAGANPRLRGIFGETALHWSALLGEDRLARKLIPVSDIDLKDEKYNSPPLGWAIHQYFEPLEKSREKQLKVASLLVVAGATIEPEWINSDRVRNDPAMLAALSRRLSR